MLERATALREKKILEEKSKFRVVISNKSKWNASVNYRNTEGKLVTEKLGLQGSANDEIEINDPDRLSYMYIVPDSKYWSQEKLEELITAKKIKVPNVAENITRVLEQHPGTSVQVEVTLPELPGGAFEGFAFAVTPRKMTPISELSDEEIEAFLKEVKEEEL